MKVVLYLDTSIHGFGIALRAKDGSNEELYKVYKSDRSSANLKLSSLVQEAFLETGIKAKDLTAVVVSKGPGSFTGIRVGLAWVQGFCQGLSCKKIGVSSLELAAKFLAKKQQTKILKVILANTKKTAFLASLENNKVDLSFVPEEDPIDISVSEACNIFMDASYEGLSREKASQIFSKEDFALLCFEALVAEVSPQVVENMEEDRALEPIYLRKSSVEEKMQKS